MQEVRATKMFLYICKMVRPFHWAIAIMFLVATIWDINLSLRPYLLKVILDKLSQSSYHKDFNYVLYSA